MDWLLGVEDIHQGPLMAPHVFYSLILAVTHLQDPCDALQDPVELEGPVEVDPAVATSNLSKLADALESDPTPRRFKAFFDACADKTNVEGQRKIRFVWLCKALAEDSL